MTWYYVKGVPKTKMVEPRVQELVQAGLLAWNERKLAPMPPVVRTRGERTVADLLLEDRERKVLYLTDSWRR